MHSQFCERAVVLEVKESIGVVAQFRGERVLPLHICGPFLCTSSEAMIGLQLCFLPGTLLKLFFSLNCLLISFSWP